LAAGAAASAAAAGELNSVIGTIGMRPTANAPRSTALRDKIFSCIMESSSGEAFSIFTADPM